MAPLDAPRLRPGFFAVQRGDGHLQIGLDEPFRVILRDSPDIRQLLAALHGGPLPATPAALDALTRLEAAGLLVHGSASDPMSAAFGDDAPRRASARGAVRVAVDGPAALVAEAQLLLASAGLTPADGEESEVALVLATSAVHRDRADTLVREGRPHLPVAAMGTRWSVGPFVVPGRTACLRCVDATLEEDDPRRAVVVEHLVDRDVPIDAVTRQLAISWAVNDLLAWVDGVEPTTWEATVIIRPAAAPERRRWRRHPHCGCAWDLLAPSA